MKIALKFEEWLNDQQNRKDLVGALARIPSMKSSEHKLSRHKSDEHKEWANIVIRIGEPHYIVVFNEAWQEFLLAKQAADNSADINSSKAHL